jgi:hypothetical protein
MPVRYGRLLLAISLLQDDMPEAGQRNPAEGLLGGDGMGAIVVIFWGNYHLASQDTTYGLSMRARMTKRFKKYWDASTITEGLLNDPYVYDY